MSIGQFGDEATPDEGTMGFRDRLESGETIQFSWTASNVRWVNQYSLDQNRPPSSPRPTGASSSRPATV